MRKTTGIVLTAVFISAGFTSGGTFQVSASAFESKAHGGFGDFPPGKTLDNDFTPGSSWRVEVQDTGCGEWIQYDLGEVKTVVAVGIAFLSGEKRSYKFKIETSADGKTWGTVFSGASGGANGLEPFETGETPARYVRLTGYGNTGIGVESPFPKWFNIVETKISVRE